MSRRNYIFITMSNVVKPKGGDDLYASQVYLGLKRVLPDKYRLSLCKMKPVNLFFNFLFLPFFLVFPIMWRAGFSPIQLFEVYGCLKKLKSNDVLIFDHFRTTFLIMFFSFLKHDFYAVHVSQNCESSVMRMASENKEYSLVKRIFFKFEASKLAFWEKIIYQRCSSISFITPEDRELSSKNYTINDKAYVLTPHLMARYNKPFSLSDKVTPAGLIVGSFHWVIKRKNLLSLLNKIDASGKSFPIIVAGSMPENFKTELKKYSFLRVYSEFESLESFCGQCTIAIAPDDVGGGFKMKILDYIEIGLPVYALKGALNGVPCDFGGINLYSSHSKMIDAMSSHYSDIEKCLSQGHGVKQLRNNFFNLNVFDSCLKKFIGLNSSGRHIVKVGQSIE